MATRKVDIGVEIVKVGVLALFLYYAFNDASLSALWKLFSTLLKVGFVVLAYLAGRQYATTYKEGWKNYLLVFYGVSVLTLMAWAGLGIHTEGADPLFGGGETIIDFIPERGERDDYALNIFLTLLIPAIYGVYKKRNA